MAITLKSSLMRVRAAWGPLSVPTIFTIAFLVILASMNRSVNLYDEGVVVTDATRVLAGEVIHRDFYANYGPAQFYILAALFKLFGPTILVARLWGVLVKASIVVAVYLLGRRVMPVAWALVSSICAMVWLGLAENTVWPAWPAFLASICSVFTLIAIFEKGPSVKRILAAGALVGLATLFRYDIGFIVCTAEAAVLFPYSFIVSADARSRLRSVVVNLAAYCAGIATVCLPVATVFWFAGAIGDLLFDVVLFPARHYAATRSLPFPLPLAGRRPLYSFEYIVYFPLLVCLGVAFTAIPLNRHRDSLVPRFRTGTEDSPRGMWELTLLCAVTLGFFSKGLVRVSAVHMSMAVIPAALILASLLSANARRKVSIGLAVFLAVAMLAGVIPTLKAYNLLTGVIANNLNHVLGRGRSHSIQSDAIDPDSCHPSPGLERIACFKFAQDQSAAVRYVQANTMVSDPIFVGLPQHERIYVNNVAFYFVANRPPATKWYHFDPALQNSKPIQELMIRDLLASRPKYVVLDAQWEGAREANESAKSSGVKLLDEFIGKNYRSVAAFGSLSVLKYSNLNSPR
ncbi:MAG TPA: glycosyltransferase family 39 protein [Steroidobacteraceae bacterium]|jgi:hypothetical protein|nr:glycosyltransferase family 39 protein [Steroidobacteraceae bacterium]